jgi:hypothetical protein
MVTRKNSCLLKMEVLPNGGNERSPIFVISHDRSSKCIFYFNEDEAKWALDFCNRRAPGWYMIALQEGQPFVGNVPRGSCAGQA